VKGGPAPPATFLEATPDHGGPPEAGAVAGAGAAGEAVRGEVTEVRAAALDQYLDGAAQLSVQAAPLGGEQ